MTALSRGSVLETCRTTWSYWHHNEAKPNQATNYGGKYWGVLVRFPLLEQ